MLYRLRAILSVAPSADSIRRFIRSKSKAGRWQAAISCTAGAIGTTLSFTEKRQGVTALLTFDNYFAFLVGIAAIAILVNSMTVGLLVYFFQSAKAAQTYYYDKFREQVAAFREYLDALHDGGFIDLECAESYQDIELLTMEDMPAAWNELFLSFLDDLITGVRENTEGTGEFNRIGNEIHVKTTLLNEAANGLWANLMQRIVMRLWVSPVVKSFRTLALMLLAVIIGAIYFDGIIANILAGLAIGTGCMTILLILEIGSLAVAESREFFDDKKDIDHSRTETHDQSSQETSGTER